jgi:hypothetical protein
MNPREKEEWKRPKESARGRVNSKAATESTETAEDKDKGANEPGRHSRSKPSGRKKREKAALHKARQNRLPAANTRHGG